MRTRLLLPLLLGIVTLATSPPRANAAESPWDLAQLSNAPAHEWLVKDGPMLALTYTGLPFQGKPSQVFAYYASPATLSPTTDTTRKYPGVVLIHGGGGTAFKAWAELWAKRGYAAIAMDLSGMRPEEADPNKRTRIPDGGPDQGHPAKFDTIRTEDLTDDWPLHAVANSILAHSLLLSFPEVDKDRTAVTGISWGGYTTCIVASVDSRFKAAVPVYGCGFLEQNSCWLGEFTKLGPDLTKKWVERYDPSSHLSRCTVPIFFMNGTNDFAYPLDSYMKSYDAVSKTAKNIRVQIKMPHGHGVGWEPKEIGLWVDQQLGLGDGKALATCTAPVLADGKVTAKITHSLPVKAAAFNYALPGEAVNKREWKSVPATIENDVVTAPAAEAESDMWFFTVTDERDAMVSSPVAFK